MLVVHDCAAPAKPDQSILTAKFRAGPLPDGGNQADRLAGYRLKGTIRASTEALPKNSRLALDWLTNK
jgi:hypothetical protein